MPNVVRRRPTRLAFDTETTGLNVWTGARPFAVSICWPDGRTRYWEWVVDPRTRRPRVKLSDVREIRSILGDESVKKYTWNGKFDCLMLESIGVEVPIHTVEEVSFMARAVNNLEFSYSLKPLAKKYVEIDDDDEKSLHDMVVRARRLAKKLGYSNAYDVESDYWLPYTLAALHPREARDADIDPAVCGRYAVRDAERTMVLGAMYEVAMDDLDVRETYRDEMDLWPVTMSMEKHGVAIDEAQMAKCRDQCEKVLEQAEARLQRASGLQDFNVASTKQLADLLFGLNSVAKLPILMRTKTGQPKTGAEALAPYKQHPIVQDVLKVRANAQALKLFFDKYAYLANEDNDGNIILHPGFKQWGTLTGRYSCSDPNLQQVSDPDTTSSIMAEFVVDVRQVFVPRPGHVWYCPDYSQIEVVIFADVSGEPTLIDAILSGQDIHGATAERVWGGEGNDRGFKIARMILDTDDDGLVRERLVECNYRITDLEKSVDKKIVRKRAKAVTFTKIFGGGPPALMRWISVSYEEAVEILNAYDDSFPTMLRRMKEIETRGKKDGYVINPFGRRLAVDPWNAYRAVNHMVQSAAADLMKRGMRQCASYLKELGLDARILLSIHDELIFEFKKGHNLKQVLREIKNRMSDHGGALNVPVKVDMDRVDERWSKKTKVEL